MKNPLDFRQRRTKATTCYVYVRLPLRPPGLLLTGYFDQHFYDVVGRDAVAFGSEAGDQAMPQDWICDVANVVSRNVDPTV